MKFEDVLHNGKLWAVVYDGDEVDILTKTLADWLNPGYLRWFFENHIKDLENYFNITNVDEAIYDTIRDATSLSCVILDLDPNANLDELFRPLENYRIREMLLSREKAKGKSVSSHRSWLRIYAIKMESNVYLVTGGTIKLTYMMQDRQHTLDELIKMEKVRNYLLENGVIDYDGLKDYEL